MLSEAWQECCHAERVSAKHLLTNTRMFAGVVFADILETVRTAFTVLAHWKAFSASRFRRSSEAVKVVKRQNGTALKTFLLENFTKSLVILKREALKNLKENIETAADILPSHRISCFVILTNLYH